MAAEIQAGRRAAEANGIITLLQRGMFRPWPLGLLGADLRAAVIAELERRGYEISERERTNERVVRDPVERSE